jgi:CubicO group peptidase (beta-lactamase class C family)
MADAMKKMFIFSLYIMLFAGCGKESFNSYTYHPPADLNDGLEVASLADIHADPGSIEACVDSIHAERYKRVHAILIFKEDRLVFEEYFKGYRFSYERPEHHGEQVNWKSTIPHRVMSVTKSVTSACIGIAVDHGYIGGVKESIFKYFPDYRALDTEGKQKITIEHLLTMTSGLNGNEWLVPYANPNNDIIMTYLSEDPVRFVLSKPLVSEPGENFQYYGGSNFLLAKILRQASGMGLDEFAGKFLFEPLGIGHYEWLKLNKGVVDGAGGLIIIPRDMLRIGITFLNRGVWKGKRIVSENWVAASGTPYPGNSWMNNWDDHWGLRGYGYSWWTHTFSGMGKRIDMFYAAGWGGQYIMVIPPLKSVVVFTGGNYTTVRSSFEILKKYILPVLDGTTEKS